MELRFSRLSRSLKLAGIAVLPWFLACSSSSRIETLQLQLDDLERQVAALADTVSTKTDLASLAAELESSNETRIRQDADLSLNLAQLEQRISTLGEQLADTTERLVELSNAVDTTQQELRVHLATIPITSEGGPPRFNTDDPEALYQSAYANYQQGNFELAILGFDEFLNAFPDSELADNALYWKGESFFSQRRFEEAVYAFARVLALHPSSEKIPSATLKRGFAHIERGEIAAGREQLQRLLKEHPSSADAELARRALRELDRPTN